MLAHWYHHHQTLPGNLHHTPDRRSLLLCSIEYHWQTTLMCVSAELGLGLYLSSQCRATHPCIRRRRMTVGTYDRERLSGKVETQRNRKRERLWRRVRQMNDEVWIFANAPVSDRSSTVPARDECLSMDKKLQAWVLAESDTRHALPDCFSHSPYEADVGFVRLSLCL